MNLVNKCIENAKERINSPKNKMNAFNYITYFVKRNELSIEDDFNIKVEFTVNGIKL